jgi:hypothetical protein
VPQFDRSQLPGVVRGLPQVQLPLQRVRGCRQQLGLLLLQQHRGRRSMAHAAERMNGRASNTTSTRLVIVPIVASSNAIT